jgi:hypothetical protein
VAVAALDDYRATSDRPPKKGRPAAPTESLVIDRVRRLQDFAADRDRVDEGQTQLLDCSHPIELPRSVARTNPPLTHAAMLERQVGLVLGTIANQRPTITVASLLRGQSRQEEAQGIGGFANRYLPLAERQSGKAVYVPKTRDQLVYGRGVTAIEPFTAQYADAPRRDDYPTADAYHTANERFTRRQGTGAGRLAVLVRRVDARSFYWLDSPERGGVYLTAERRVRTLADLLGDPRYAGALDGTPWATWYDGVQARDRRAANQARVGLWIVQDPDYCSYLVDPLPVPDSADDTADTAVQWGAHSLGATLVRTHPNRLGRPNYVVTRGQPSSSADAARDTQGIGYPARWLLRAVCEILTLRGIRARDQAWPAWLAIRGPQPGASAQVMPDPLPPEQQKIELTRGNNMVTILDNVTLQQVLSRGSDDEIPYAEKLEKHANDLMLPDAIMETGASGYAYNSLVNTVRSRLNPVLQGQATAAIEEFHLVWDWYAAMGEPLSVTAIERGNAVSYTVDPRDVDWEDLVIESALELERPEDVQAKIQQVVMAVEKGVRSMKSARSAYLHLENSAAEDEQIALENYLKSPDVQQAIQQRAARDAGILLDQEQAAAEGPPDLATLLQLSEPLLKALAMTVAPGQPGYEAIMAAMQQANLQPPPQAQQPPAGGGVPSPPPPAAGSPPVIGGGPPPMGPPPGPVGPPAVPLPGGRAPGQNVQPGGGRMTGGLA